MVDSLVAQEIAKTLVSDLDTHLLYESALNTELFCQIIRVMPCRYLPDIITALNQMHEPALTANLP